MIGVISLSYIFFGFTFVVNALDNLSTICVMVYNRIFPTFFVFWYFLFLWIIWFSGILLML